MTLSQLRRISFTDWKSMPRVLSETEEGQVVLDTLTLNRQMARRVANILGYFAQNGRLPDPELAQKIRNHSWVVKKLDNEDARTRKLEPLICHHCQILHLWKEEACEKCGHDFQIPEDVPCQVLENILKDLDQLYERDLKIQEMNRLYPLPEERGDETYHCQSCGKSYITHNSFSYRERRIACSTKCLFEIYGRPIPEDRKFRGFLSIWPSFKGKEVVYLGAIAIELTYKKPVICECYQALSQTYAFWGDGDREYTCWMTGAYASRDSEKAIQEAGISPIDESWRILANVKENYSWK